MPSAATKKTEEKKTIISLEAKGFYSDSIEQSKALQTSKS